MFNNLLAYVTVENIYLAANWGVIPFWLLLILYKSLVHELFHPIYYRPFAFGYWLYLFDFNLYLEENIFDGLNYIVD